jgi:hypothetical protein
MSSLLVDFERFSSELSDMIDSTERNMLPTLREQFSMSGVHEHSLELDLSHRHPLKHREEREEGKKYEDNGNGTTASNNAFDSFNTTKEGPSIVHYEEDELPLQKKPEEIAASSRRASFSSSAQHVLAHNKELVAKLEKFEQIARTAQSHDKHQLAYIEQEVAARVEIGLGQLQSTMMAKFGAMLEQNMRLNADARDRAARSVAERVGTLEHSLIELKVDMERQKGESAEQLSVLQQKVKSSLEQQQQRTAGVEYTATALTQQVSGMAQAVARIEDLAVNLSRVGHESEALKKSLHAVETNAFSVQRASSEKHAQIANTVTSALRRIEQYNTTVQGQIIELNSVLRNVVVEQEGHVKQTQRGIEAFAEHTQHEFVRIQENYTGVMSTVQHALREVELNNRRVLSVEKSSGPLPPAAPPSESKYDTDIDTDGLTATAPAHPSVSSDALSLLEERMQLRITQTEALVTESVSQTVRARVDGIARRMDTLEHQQANSSVTLQQLSMQSDRAAAAAAPSSASSALVDEARVDALQQQQAALERKGERRDTSIQAVEEQIELMRAKVYKLSVELVAPQKLQQPSTTSVAPSSTSSFSSSPAFRSSFSAPVEEEEQTDYITPEPTLTITADTKASLSSPIASSSSPIPSSAPSASPSTADSYSFGSPSSLEEKVDQQQQFSEQEGGNQISMSSAADSYSFGSPSSLEEKVSTGTFLTAAADSPMASAKSSSQEEFSEPFVTTTATAAADSTTVAPVKPVKPISKLSMFDDDDDEDEDSSMASPKPAPVSAVTTTRASVQPISKLSMFDDDDEEEESDESGLSDIDLDNMPPIDEPASVDSMFAGLSHIKDKSTAKKVFDTSSNTTAAAAAAAAVKPTPTPTQTQPPAAPTAAKVPVNNDDIVIESVEYSDDEFDF